MKKKILIVDPPSGWMYGFPRPYNPKKGETQTDWFKRMGYPENLIKQGMLKYCRFWEHECETK